MPKSMVVDPQEKRAASVVQINDIPVNQYVSDPAKELATYGAEKMKRVYHDMRMIREFENMLNTIKTTGFYRTVKN